MPQLLQEVVASVVLTDVQGFIALGENLGPVELGVALSAFYAHVGGIGEKHGGRIVKLVGDGVMIGFVGMKDHCDRALAAVAEMSGRREAWLADNAKIKLPRLDYTASAASGEMLVGELGTDRVRFWDMLGAPVTLAFKLCQLAGDRGIANLIDAATIENAGAEAKQSAIEVEGAKLGRARHRLFQIK